MHYISMIVASLFLLVCSLQAQVHQSCNPIASPEATPSTISYEGGNGTSFSEAVVIKGAPNSDIGVPAEYDWLAKNYPGYRMFRQRTVTNDGKCYDILYITNARDAEITIYFDITNFFGM